MAVNATKREKKEFSQLVGFFEGEIVDVNPDKEGLKKLLGEDVDIKEEPKYVADKQDNEGNSYKQLILAFWLRDVKSKQLFPLKFFINSKDKENRDGTKTQYLNSQGASTWADDINNLPEWFLKVGAENVRVAKEGEADFYEFVRNWLNQIDYKQDYEILFDMKKLYNGNYKEIKELMKSDVAGTVLALATIKTVTDKESGEVKTYQQVYNRAFGAGYLMKQIRAKKLDNDFIEAAEEAKRNKKTTPLQRLVLNISDSEFGVKDFYKLTELTEYKPEENVAAGNKELDPQDSSY